MYCFACRHAGIDVSSDPLVLPLLFLLYFFEGYSEVVWFYSRLFNVRWSPKYLNLIVMGSNECSSSPFI